MPQLLSLAFFFVVVAGICFVDVVVVTAPFDVVAGCFVTQPVARVVVCCLLYCCWC